MVDSAFGDFEDVPVDAKPTQESAVFSEEKLYASDIFRMFCFKVLPCCKLYNHNWKTCPFLHEGEKAGRRDPQKYRYVGIECQDAKKGECPRGDSCPYAHNLFEFWLHPSRYRTQLCNKPSACRRKVCFFAHNVMELRQPSIGNSDTDGCEHALKDTDTDQSEELHLADEVSSLGSTYENGQTGHPPLPPRKLFRSVSSPYQDSAYTVSPVPSSFASECSVSAQPSPACSPVPPRVCSDLKRCSSTMSPMRDHTSTAPTFPMIPAFREPFESQLDTLQPYPFGVLPESMLLSTTKASCKEAYGWKIDSPLEGSLCLTNVNSLTDDGEI